MTKEIRFCLNADEAPSLPGAYAMAIELTDEVAVTLSGRSPIVLPAGRYLYCGSANGPGGLKARLSRHMRRGKSVALASARWCKCVHICQCQLPGSAAVIARPAAVICCSGRTGRHYYCPTLISADAFKASSAFLSRKAPHEGFDVIARHTTSANVPNNGASGAGHHEDAALSHGFLPLRRRHS